MLKLVVDSREARLADGLKVIGVPFQTAGLDVGDFMIQTEAGEPLMVVERKSLADFAASNADGRYREQRARLMAVRGSGVAVLYVLEGAWSLGDPLKMYGRTPEKQLQRLVTRLVLRYGMPVMQTEGILDTARLAALLLEQLTDDPTVFVPEGDLAMSQVAAMAGMTAVLSTAKKGNKTAAGTAHAMLSASARSSWTSKGLPFLRAWTRFTTCFTLPRTSGRLSRAWDSGSRCQKGGCTLDNPFDCGSCGLIGRAAFAGPGRRQETWCSGPRYSGEL